MVSEKERDSRKECFGFVFEVDCRKKQKEFPTDGAKCCKRLNDGTELRLQDRETGQRCAGGWSSAATPTIKLDKEGKCLSV